MNCKKCGEEIEEVHESPVQEWHTEGYCSWACIMAELKDYKGGWIALGKKCDQLEDDKEYNAELVRERDEEIARMITRSEEQKEIKQDLENKYIGTVDQLSTAVHLATFYKEEYATTLIEKQRLSQRVEYLEHMNKYAQDWENNAMKWAGEREKLKKALELIASDEYEYMENIRIARKALENL